MRIVRFLLKIIIFPVILIVTVIQWLVFIIGFSSIVFNILAGLFFFVAILSYLMGQSAGAEAVKMILVGFGIFMVPIIGEWFIGIIATLNMEMRTFIRF